MDLIIVICIGIALLFIYDDTGTKTNDTNITKELSISQDKKVNTDGKTTKE